MGWFAGRKNDPCLPIQGSRDAETQKFRRKIQGTASLSKSGKFAKPSDFSVLNQRKFGKRNMAQAQRNTQRCGFWRQKQQSPSDFVFLFITISQFTMRPIKVGHLQGPNMPHQIQGIFCRKVHKFDS